mgnify:CR=1 FL=1
MKFRRQRAKEVNVDLTPLIDVVFLLLIFFMVSTTFTKETHLEINLPQAEGQAQTDPPEVIDILIAQDGTFSVNGTPLVNTQPDTLKRALRELSGGDNERPLTITADAKTPHQSVVTAMDVAGQLGFSRLSITTQEPVSE